MRLITTILILLLSCVTAHADGTLESVLTAADKARLAAFDAVKAKALSDARAQGNAADIAVLDAALAGTPQKISEGFDATGTWRCRVIKMGGILPLTVYPNFKCTITDDGAGWYLKKTTGSQRSEGRFFTESETRLVYVGAGHVQGESPRRYGTDAREDQVAIAELLAPNRLVLQFPQPHYESHFDLLVLER